MGDGFSAYGDTHDLEPFYPDCMSPEFDDYATPPYTSRTYGDGAEASFNLQIYHVPMSETAAAGRLIEALPDTCGADRNDESQDFRRIPFRYGDSSSAYRGYNTDEVNPFPGAPGKVNAMILFGNWVVYAEAIDYASAQLMDASLVEVLGQIDHSLGTGLAEPEGPSGSLRFPEPAFLATSGWRAEYPVYKPQETGLSGDSTFFLEGMTWSQWSASRATGQGTELSSDCVPSCAEAELRRYPVQITLEDVEMICGLPFYTTLKIRYLAQVPDFAESESTWQDREPPFCETS